MGFWQRAQSLVFGSVAVAVIAGGALMTLSVQADSNALAARIDAARVGLDSLRLLAMVLLVVLWGPLVQWRGRSQGLEAATVAALIKQRWTLALVLLGIELVLVQNLPDRLWEWLS